MSAPAPSTRRLAIAIGAAVSSATIAIGVTAASLLGWFRPGDAPPAEPASLPADPAPGGSPVILVPIVPAPAPAPAPAPEPIYQLAMEDTVPVRYDEHGDDDDDDDDDHDDDDHDDDDHKGKEHDDDHGEHDDDD